MTYNKYLTLLLFLSAISCAEKEPRADYTGPFFGVIPTDIPQLLAPDLIATPAVEYNGTFSPDGTEFYYTTDVPENAFITFTKLLPDNTWSKPQVASFSDLESNFDPLFSPDGSKLYFSSSRPAADNEDSKIWYVDRTDNGWGSPQQLSLTGKAKEYYSSVTNNADIYFNTWPDGTLMKATKTDSSYFVESLAEKIEGDYAMGDPFISPEEDYLIFRGYGDDSFGRGDLYICFNIDGTWTVPKNLGEPINSKSHEMCPLVTQDGKLFIFASERVQEKINTTGVQPLKNILEKHQSYDNGRLNIYYMSAGFIDEMRAEYLE